jgi:HEAT repeat protein
MRRRYLGLIMVAFLALGLGLWFGRTQLLARYYVYQLACADAGDREVWIGRIINLDEIAVPSLVECLSRNDDRACVSITTAIQKLTARWGLDDPRAIALSAKLADAFPAMSVAGQEWVLKLGQSWMARQEKDDHRNNQVLHNAARLLGQAAGVDNSVIRGQALALADNLSVEIALDPIIPQACRELAQVGLRDAEPANRVHSIRLAQAPGVDLLPEVVPCMRDPSAAVRRAAILALGPSPETINDDTLFYWLSDPDPEIRQLCEVALRGRGLQDHHIRLAKLMADPRPSVRMQVLEIIDQAPDLDPGVWLRRLSHDPSPAVRAATARAAAAQTQVDLSDRIDQMAQTDPSPTVQQVARYYLSCQRILAGQLEKP